MRPIDLVETFCDVNLDQHDSAIGESLTKLAFEAVEKIINVSLKLLLHGDGWILIWGILNFELWEVITLVLMGLPNERRLEIDLQSVYYFRPCGR